MEKTDSKMVVHMIGNAHIDPVWLWNWQAGVDEALATFRSAVDRCEEYPEFVFTRGEAWLYQQVEKIDPGLFGRVRELVGRGQWHVTGGQYIHHQQIVVVNPDPEPREGYVETEPFLDFDVWGERWLSDPEGNPIDFQLVQPEASLLTSRVVFPVRIEAGRHAQVLVRDDEPPDRDGPDTDLRASPHGLSNAHLSVVLDGRGVGDVVSNGLGLLGEEGVRLHLRQDHTDTWTFHADRFEEPVDEEFSGGEWVVEERGPLRARVRMEGRLGNSRFRWTLTLYRDAPQLLMRLEVNFGERFKLLQMPLHLAEAPEKWVDGSGIGTVRRVPGPVEWPVQGFSRVEVGGGHLALVTSDAYSLSLKDRTWQWTLLRSPKMAWSGGEPQVYSGHDWHTDQGIHTFGFELHVGESLEATRLNVAARQQAQPPVVFDRYEGMDRPPWGNSPPRSLWLEAEQKTLADGRMTHLLNETSPNDANLPFPDSGTEKNREEQQ